MYDGQTVNMSGNNHLLGPGLVGQIHVNLL